MRARTPVAVVLLAALAGCASCDAFGDRHVVFNHPNGQRAAEGLFSPYLTSARVRAAEEKRDPVPWTTYMRTGTWRYWHPNGVLRAEITYAIDFYKECCADNPCRGSYERIVGTPRVFDANGTPVMLVRAPERAWIGTNCGGSVEVFRPAWILPEDLAPEWDWRARFAKMKRNR